MFNTSKTEFSIRLIHRKRNTHLKSTRNDIKEMTLIPYQENPTRIFVTFITISLEDFSDPIEI